MENYQTNTIIYGIGSLIVSITLIALIRNLFCRKSNIDDHYSKNKRYNSRSYADYSRSTNKERSYADLQRNYSNSVYNNNRKYKQQSIHNNDKKISRSNTETNKTPPTSNLNNTESTTITINSTNTSSNTNSSSTPNTTTISSNPSISSTNNIIHLSIQKQISNNRRHNSSQESFSLSNPTPTPAEIQKPTSPIPQFTPFDNTSEMIITAFEGNYDHNNFFPPLIWLYLFVNHLP